MATKADAIPTLDLYSVTLGEAEALEHETGRSFDQLMRAGKATRRLLALWLDERRRPSRSSGLPLTWHELGDRPLFARPSSSSDSEPDGVSPTSEV